MIPVALPVFAAVFIYAAVGHWNSWFDVILYNFNGKFDTLQVYLRRLLLEVEATQQILDQQLLIQKFQGLSPLDAARGDDDFGNGADPVRVPVPAEILYRRH